MIATDARKPPRFYRAEDFLNGHDADGREVAGWVGYTAERYSWTSCRTHEVEDMVPVRIGATCPVPVAA